MPPQTSDMTADAPDELALAQDCVMCGICVPHCPTFALSDNEADGPRGRISMVLGLQNGRLSADDDVVTHIDSCLGCRACEDVCPSKVQYGRLLDATRSALAHRTLPNDTDDGSVRVGNRASRPTWRWLRDRILSQRKRLRSTLKAASTLQRLGAGSLIGRLRNPTLAALWHNRPNMPLGRRPIFGTHQAKASSTPQGKRLGLFVGCTGEATNANAVNAAIRVLSRLGYEVRVPDKQVCCGAMHRHGGEPQQADSLVSTNAKAFASEQVDTIVVVGSGCAAELHEQLPGTPIRELTAFLAEIDDAAWPPLGSNESSVAIHTPCSQVRVLHEADASRTLLGRIPGLRLVDLKGNDRCCGAAGMHVLLYPEQAAQLRAPKLADAMATTPNYLVSVNIGCAMHLATGLTGDEAGKEIRVIQPVELIAQALDAA